MCGSRALLGPSQVAGGHCETRSRFLPVWTQAVVTFRKNHFYECIRTTTQLHDKQTTSKKGQT